MAKNRIKELRKAHKLTLNNLVEMLAEKGIKVNESQLSKFENGTSTPRNNELWEVLSELLNADVSYILGYTDSNFMSVSELAREFNKPDYAQDFLEKTGKVFDEEARTRMAKSFLEDPKNIKNLNKKLLYSIFGKEDTNFNLKLENFVDEREAILKLGIAKLLTESGIFLNDTDIDLIVQMAMNLSEKNVGKDLQDFFDNLDEEEYSLTALAFEAIENDEDTD